MLREVFYQEENAMRELFQGEGTDSALVSLHLCRLVSAH